MRKTHAEKMVVWAANRQKAVELRQQGMPLDEIGRKLRPKVTRQRVHAILKAEARMEARRK